MKRKLLKITIVCLVALLIAPLCAELLPSAAAAKQQSSAEIKKEIEAMEKEQDDLEKRLEELETQKSENRESLDQMIEQKNIIDQQITVLNDQLTNINERIASQTLLIANKQIELENARKDLALMRQKYKERIRAMEEGGTVSYWAVLFEASDFSDLLDRMNMIQEIAESDTKRIEVLDKITKEVEDAKLQLDEEKRALDKNKKEMESKQVEMAKKREEADAILAELLAKDREYAELVDQVENEKSDMQDAIDKLSLKFTEAELREAEEAAANAAASGSVTNKMPVHTDKNGIQWAEPCEYGRVSSPFGYRYHPVTGEWKGHKGIDLTRPKWAVSTGKPVPIYATRAGIVSYTGYDKSGGNIVNIDHSGDYRSQYMHLDSYVVKMGEKVHMGQLIGYMGNTGIGTGPHLHFTIRHYERYEKTSGNWVWGYNHYNPAEFIKFR